MRIQKSLGVNALQEEVEAIDKRREELGLSRAKYLTTLAKLDIEHELLIAEKAGDGRPIINLVTPNKPVVRIEKEDMEAWGRQIAVMVAKLCITQINGPVVSDKQLHAALKNL